MNIKKLASVALTYSVTIFGPAVVYGVRACQTILFKPDSTAFNTQQKVKAEMQPFFEEMNAQDVIVQETPSHLMPPGLWVCATGNTLISVASEVCTAEPEGCKFFIKHEVAHIQHKDALTLVTVPFLVSTISGVASLVIFPHVTVTHILALWATAKFTEYAVSQNFEDRADDFAIHASSIAELKGGKRLIMANQQVNLKVYEIAFSFVDKMFSSPNGELYFDLYHPSLASRMKKLDSALEGQGVYLTEQEKQKDYQKATLLADILIQHAPGSTDEQRKALLQLKVKEL